MFTVEVLPIDFEKHFSRKKNDKSLTSNEINPERPFVCDYESCNKSYTTKSHLLRHRKVVHSGEVLPKKIFICDICQDDFQSKQSIEKHMIRRHLKKFPFNCEYCQNGFKTSTQLARHLYLHTGLKLLKCEFCDKKFENQPARSKHQRNHKTFICECNQKFSRWTELLRHKRTEHNRTSRFECDVCQRIFKVRKYIIRHLKVHTGIQDMFSCPYCPKYYPYKSNLTHHINSIHGNLTYDCTFPGCEAKLSTKKSLQIHNEKIHNPNTLQNKEKVNRPRKRRRDVGSMVRSTAVKLSGESVPLEIEKEIIKESEKFNIY